jgi:type IV secretion system protein VirB10
MMITIPFILALLAQDPAPAAPPASVPAAAPAATAVKNYQVEPGTRIPLSLLNSISTKNAAEGDRVYLETLFPILVNNRIVIPVGSSVAGTVTSVKRAGRVKGRAELFVRFDTLILPNGVLRDFRSRLSNVDGTNPGRVDRGEGKIEGEGNKGGDARTVAETAVGGTFIGGLAGAAAGNAGMGMGIGAAAGAAAAMIGILATRGPDAILTKGTTVEMMLDRTIAFQEDEINFAGIPAPARRAIVEPAPVKRNERPGWRPY